MVVDHHQQAPWIIMLLLLLLLLTKLESSSAAAAAVAKPGCQDSCGGIRIPYPFGIGPNCSANEAYSITCKNSITPILNIINLQLLNFSLTESTFTVLSPVIASNCANKENGKLYPNLTGTPFSYSDRFSRFTAVGCNNQALITREDNVVIGGCMSNCNENDPPSASSLSSCVGIKCCQTIIPPSLQFIKVSLASIDPRNSTTRDTCKYTFMVDREWFSNVSAGSVLDMPNVPAVLDWKTYSENCMSFGVNQSSTNNNTNSLQGSLCSTNAFCGNRSSVYACSCDPGYAGNPYLFDGCQDINECAIQDKNYPCPAGMSCLNTPGSYTCYNNKEWMIITGICSGIGVLVLLIGVWWLWKILKRRKKNKLKQKFFKRNGGLLLQQQLSSGEGNAEKTKVFTSKELEKATDNYNQTRILGQGGQGTVFKGMLTDGRIVAIKKSMIMDEGQLEQFINEVVILSQIDHRNIVKIFGCCLETEVPLLVYEFIPNGTLFQYIHEENEELPVSWNKRVQIAAEVARALSYLHSAASIPIYHRDIKSSNILLDDKYRAKVADFGTSRSLAIDQTHLTTRVMGTFGYLDPEYFQSSQFTEKSDVYSFGVVLVELLTGQKAILSTVLEEVRSLATHFILTMEENKLYDILDARVLKEGGSHEIMAVANLAKRCLNLSGRKRPTMREVAMELEGIILSQGASITQNNEDVEYEVAELNGPWDVTSTSTGSFIDTRGSLSIDVQPLLLK